MKNEIRTKEMTLRFIAILVWFEVLWASVFVVGLVFQWSGLTNQLMTAFFASGFCALILIAALALLNFSANLSIIADAQMKHCQPIDIKETKLSYTKTLVIAGTLIALVVGSLWIAEWKLYQTKIQKARSKIEVIANTQAVVNILKIISEDSTKSALIDQLTTLSNETTEREQFAVLFPKTQNNTTIYYEIGLGRYAGESGKDSAKVSAANYMLFKPNDREKKWLDRQKDGKDVFFGYAKGGDDLRALLRVESDKGHIILLFDTTRRSTYKRDSF